MRFSHPSLRTRLALWHTAILAALLAASAVVSVRFLRTSSRDRTDADLIDTWSAFRSELVAEREELPTVAAATKEALNEFRFNNVAVAVMDSTHRVLGFKAVAARATGDEGNANAFDPAHVAKLLPPGIGDRPSLITAPDREGGYRVYSASIHLKGDAALILVARSLHEDSETLENAEAAFALVVPLVLLLAFLGGWFLAGRSLSPVGAMSDRAARISASTTAERLPVLNPDDELGRLAAVLNDLLDRLAEALDQQRRFMTDASHELRTPVAVVRTVAEVVLSKETRSDAEYREALDTVNREARRLNRVVDDLFLLSRADIGERPLHDSSLYLGEVIADAARDVGAIAQGRDIRIECKLPEDGSPFTGDEQLLDRAFGNLIDNAIKYGPQGSRVRISLSEESGNYRIDFEDEGPGVPSHLKEKIFERFFRAIDDESNVQGAGLGLSIARWAVEAHGGRLVVGRAGLGGARFTVTLPKGSDNGRPPVNRL